MPWPNSSTVRPDAAEQERPDVLKKRENSCATS
jgi:hypothetical protein